MNNLKLILVVLISILFGSCQDMKNSNEENKKSMELKEKELELRERELDLKEKELADKSNNQTENLSSGTKGNYPEVSLIKLTDTHLQNRDEWELRIMRNEVFARYGYIFKLPELREYFILQNWYTPKYDDVSNMLSELEKENVEKIRKYEAYIGSRYNSFSR